MTRSGLAALITLVLGGCKLGIGAPLLAAGIVLVLSGVGRMKKFRVVAARGGLAIQF